MPCHDSPRHDSPRLDLTSPVTYAESCLRIAREDFAGQSVAEVAAMEDDYNVYPGLERLQPPRNILIQEDCLNDNLLEQARRAILDGLIFWEHAAAGEATRLKLGPKYFIHPHRLPPSYCRRPLEGAGETASVNPSTLLPLVLGARHLNQWAFEVTRLAEQYGQDPAVVLARQKMLLIVNELNRDEVRERVLRAGFLGLRPRHVLFMAQPNYHGLTAGPQGWRFDGSTPLKLHNHGQMAMQKTMDRQIYHLDAEGGEHRLSQADFFSLLGETADLVSYNIEDLDYLLRALDFETIGLALEMGGRGFGMTMEIVSNNPERPVKGGFCGYDPALKRDVVVESFRLRGMEPKQIQNLNKNFNHYPNPAGVFKKLHQEGIFMPVVVKDGAVYFQPVQGDLNFLVRTAYITRRVPAPLRSWKAPDDTPAALAAMARQDSQPGFADFVGRRRGPS